MIETEVTSIEDLRKRLDELNQQLADAQRERQNLVENRPVFALRARLGDADARAELGALDARCAAFDIDVRDITDATRALEREIIEWATREQEQTRLQAEQDAYVAEVRRIDASRKLNHEFVQAARVLWDVWCQFETDQEASLAFHRLHYLAIERANQRLKNVLFGRLAGDLQIGRAPLEGE